MASAPVQVRIAGATDVGLIREHNEDSFLVVDLDREGAEAADLGEATLGPRGALLVVCDGMGGAAAGEVASAMAVQGMRRILQRTVSPEATAVTPAASAGAAPGGAAPLSGAVTEPLTPLAPEPEDPVRHLALQLRDATYGVNQEIFEAACADMAKAGMGTTLTAMLLRRDRVIVAQVGDSRAYLCRRGRLTQITHDQSLVNQLLDTGQITPEQAKLFEHSNVILQALGVQEDVEVLLSAEELRRGDRLLLCSDGLVGVVSDEEIQEVLGLGAELPQLTQTLIDMARAAGGPDNITVILAEVGGEGLPEVGEGEEVAYRPVLLDEPGTRPRGRRELSLSDVFPGLLPTPPPPPPPPLSMASALSMAWVVGLAIAGVVVGFLLYPTELPARRPHAGALCYFTAEGQGLDLLVDGERLETLAAPGTELRLSPGAHRIALRDSRRGAGGALEEQWIHVSPGQRCAYRLRAPGEGRRGL